MTITIWSAVRSRTFPSSSMPSMPGRMMSVRMTSKASPSILASASSAELTASTSYPSRPKTRLSDSRSVVSSSTMRRRFVMMA